MDTTHYTSTTSWTPNNGNKDTGYKEPCPEGSVPLNRLCDRCQRFFDNQTEVHAWFDEPQLPPDIGNWSIPHPLFPDMRTSQTNPEASAFEFCTVAQLMESQEFCHFCKMLISNLDNYDDVLPHEPVICQNRFYGNENWPSMWMNLKSKGQRGVIVHFLPFSCELFCTPLR
jgi:hypothetical protein